VGEVIFPRTLAAVAAVGICDSLGLAREIAQLSLLDWGLGLISGHLHSLTRLPGQAPSRNVALRHPAWHGAAQRAIRDESGILLVAVGCCCCHRCCQPLVLFPISAVSRLRAGRPGALAFARATPLRRLADAGPGTPLHVVSEVLGHASIAVTKDVYGHLLEGDKRAAAESMSRALFRG